MLASKLDLDTFVKNLYYDLDTFTQLAQLSALQPPLPFNELIERWYLSCLIAESKHYSDLKFNDLPKDILLKNYIHCFPNIDDSNTLFNKLIQEKFSLKNNTIGIPELVNKFKPTNIFPFKFKNIPFNIDLFNWNNPYITPCISHNIILHMSFVLDTIFSTLDEHFFSNNPSHSAQKRLNSLSTLLELKNLSIGANPSFDLSKDLPQKEGTKIKNESTMLLTIFEHTFNALRNYNIDSSSSTPLKILFYLYTLNRYYYIFDILIEEKNISRKYRTAQSINLSDSFLLTNIYCFFHAKEQSPSFYEKINSILFRWKIAFNNLLNENTLDTSSINNIFDQLASFDSVKSYLLASPVLCLMEDFPGFSTGSHNTSKSPTNYYSLCNRFFKNRFYDDYTSASDKLFKFDDSYLGFMPNPFLELKLDYSLSKNNMDNNYFGCILKYFDMQRILLNTKITKSILISILEIAEIPIELSSKSNVIKAFKAFHKDKCIPSFFKISNICETDLSPSQISMLNHTTLLIFFNACCSFSCKNINGSDIYRPLRSTCSRKHRLSCFQEFLRKINTLNESINS